RQIVDEVKSTGKAVAHKTEGSALMKTLDISKSPCSPDIRNGNANPAYVLHVGDEQHSEYPLGQSYNKTQRGSKATKSRRNDTVVKLAYEEDVQKIKVKPLLSTIPNQREVCEYIRVFHQPPIHSRQSSLAIRKVPNAEGQPTAVTSAVDYVPSRA